MKKTHSTALCIIPPKEQWDSIQAIRQKYDSAYERWMPHINVIYPFVEDTEFSKVIPKLEKSVGDIPPFVVYLNSFHYFYQPEEKTVHLVPDDGNNGSLFSQLYTKLKGCFKSNDEKNQRRGRTDFSPHLTVAQEKSNEFLEIELSKNWKKISFTVQEVYVISRTDDQPFEIRAVIPLKDVKNYNFQPIQPKVNLDKLLFTHYALQHNKLLLRGEKSKKVSDLAKNMIRFVMVHYNIQNVKELIQREDLLMYLFKELQKKEKYKQGLEQMDFYQREIIKLEDLTKFLSTITDKSLLERFDQILKNSEECFICMDKEADCVLECSHEFCQSCIYSISNVKKECPFCRKGFQNFYNKKDVEKKEKVEVKKEKDTLDIISSDQIDIFLTKRLTTLFSSSGKASEREKEEINVIVLYSPKLVMDIYINSKIPSEEIRLLTLAFLSKSLFPHEPKSTKLDTEETFSKFASTYLSNPNRVLRFLSVLNGGEPDPNSKIAIKFNKRFKTFLLTSIDAWKMDDIICEQFKQHSQIWKLFFLSCHVREYKNLKNIQNYSDFVRGNKPFPLKSPISRLEQAFSKKDTKEIIKISQENPGLFFRNASRICYAFPDLGDEFIEVSLKIVENNRIEQLIELIHAFRDDFTMIKDNNVSYVTKLGTLNFNDKKKHQPKTKLHAKLSEVFEKVLIKKLSEKKNSNVDICYLDKDSLENLRIKKGTPEEQAKFTTKIPGTRGDVVDLSKLPVDAEIVLYNFWKYQKNHIFLDLTLFGLKKNFEFNPGFVCDFGNTNSFNQTMIHSGDLTDENGKPICSQYMKFNIENLKKKNTELRYIILANLSYSQVPFDDLEEGCVGIGYKTKEIQGKGPYESIVLDACNLRGSSKMNLGLVLNLETQKVTFMNINITSKKSKGVITVHSSHKLLSKITQCFVHWTISSSSPCSWLEVATYSSIPYGKIIVKSGTQLLYYEKKKNESDEQFKQRIFRKGSDELPSELEGILKGKKSESEKLWLFYGNEDFSKVQLPKGSYVIDPNKVTGDSSLIHLEDPYKVFYLK